MLTLFVVALPGCGNSDPAEGLISNIDKAKNVRTLASLQQALITINVVQADSGPTSSGALAVALQQRDPSNQYTTAPPTDAGIVQVFGGSGPVMLVGLNSPLSSPRPPYYLAVWSSGGSTLFYIGRQPPQYTAQPPSAPGWSASPPQI